MPFLRCAMLFVVLAASIGNSAAQSAVDVAASAKSTPWPEALYEAIRQGWHESRADVYECSQQLREERKLRHLSWREQSQFLAQCVKEREPIVADRGSTFARAKTWTQEQWVALKAHWLQDRERFRQCSKQLKEIAMVKRLSLHDERDFLYHCMSEER